MINTITVHCCRLMGNSSRILLRFRVALQNLILFYVGFILRIAVLLLIRFYDRTSEKILFAEIRRRSSSGRKNRHSSRKNQLELFPLIGASR